MGLRSAEKLSLPDPQFPYGDSRPCTNAAQNQQAPHRGQPPHSSRPAGSLPSALRPSPGPQGRAEPRADGRLPTHRTPRSTALSTPPPKRSPPSGPGAAGSAPAWAGTGSGTARSEPPQPGPGPVPTAAPTAPSRSRVRRQLPSSRGACAPLTHRTRGEEHLPAGGDGGEQGAAALPHGIRSPIAGPPHCRGGGRKPQLPACTAARDHPSSASERGNEAVGSGGGRVVLSCAMAEPGAYRCVECSREAAELYRDYRHGVLRIAVCVSRAGADLGQRGCNVCGGAFSYCFALG